jgi:alpha-1,2-mannosyltransferase
METQEMRAGASNNLGFFPFLRNAAWLSRDRVVAYSRLLIILQVVALIVLALVMRGFFGLITEPNSTDFLSFYAAGHMADQGQAAAIYDQPAHYHAQEQAFGAPGLRYFAFFYPPIFILICAVFGWMPYLVAFYFWIAGTLALFLLAIRKIVGPAMTVLPIASYPAVFLTVAVGQNSFLTAALFAFGTVLLDKKPFAAGLCLGALIFKPHFGLLLPVALIAGREWRAMLGAAAMVLTLILLSLLAFGIDTWRGFLELSQGTSQAFQNGSVNFFLMVSPFSAVRMLGGGAVSAWAVQGAVTLIAMIAVAVVWGRPTRPAARAAVLVAATMIALPVILFYDLTLAGVAIAWILRDARTTGYHPWEKITLVLVFCAPMMAISAAFSLKWPIGLIATGLLFVLAVRRALSSEFVETVAVDGTR